MDITERFRTKRKLEVIRQVAEGRGDINRLAAEHLDTDTSQLPHEPLSDRELQVVRLIAAGRETQEIAERLSINSSTVRSHR